MRVLRFADSNVGHRRSCDLAAAIDGGFSGPTPEHIANILVHTGFNHTEGARRFAPAAKLFCFLNSYCSPLFGDERDVIS
jgi:hypothetical protein